MEIVNDFIPWLEDVLRCLPLKFWLKLRELAQTEENSLCRSDRKKMSSESVDIKKK